MVLTVRCLICHKELKYSYGDASELVLHIKSDHPLVELKRNSESRKQFEDIHKTLTKEAIETFVRNSKVLNKLVDQEAQTVDVENDLIMDHSMIVPVASRVKKDSIVSSKSPKMSPRPSDRESIKSNKSPRDSSVSKELPKRISKEVSPVESFRSPAGSLFESTRNSRDLRAPESPPKKSISPVVSPPKERANIATPLRETTPQANGRHNVSSPKETTPQTNRRHHVPSPRETNETLANGKHHHYTTDNSEVPESQTAVADSTTKRNKLYRTSLQKWRPGGAKLSCPNCGETRQPVIRAHTERVTHSALGAALIATCWPFCLAPCLFTEPFIEFIHCSVCDYYLGKYDHKQSVLLPNTNMNK